MKILFTNIDEYILLFPEDIQEKLRKLREMIISHDSDIEEYIGIKCLLLNIKGNPWSTLPVIKSILAFIPEQEGLRNLKKILPKEIIHFQKGAVQFPINEKLPSELINRIIRFRIGDIEQKNPETYIPGS